MEDTSFVPRDLQYDQVTPGNEAELSPCILFLYDKLHVEIVQEGDEDNAEEFRLELRFLNVQERVLAANAQHFQIIAELRPEATTFGLYKLIRRATNSGFQLTRQVKERLSALLVIQAKNEKMKIFANDIIAGNNGAAVPNMSNFEAFEVVFGYFADILEAALMKAAMGITFYEAVAGWTADVTRLRTRVSEMLADLGDRAEANTLAMDIIARRRESQVLYEQFVNKNLQDGLHVKYNTHFSHNYEEMVQVRFDWNEFRNSVRNRALVTTTCFRTQAQVVNILDDAALKEYSGEVDNFVEKIRAYAPGHQAIIESKKVRLLKRITELKADYERFESSTEKSAARAKVLLDTLKFISRNCEEINLNGVDYSQNGVGISPDEVAIMMEAIENYIDKEETKKKKAETALKISSSEYTKSIPASKLPKLESPADFLQWSQVTKAMFKVITNDLSRVCLIKASLVNAVDKSFLESCYDSAEILTFLKRKYSDRSYIISMELAKLYRMRVCGEDVKSMIENSEKFLLTLALFRSHGLLAKIDRSVRDKLIDRVFTTSQKNMFSIEAVRSESYWVRYDAGKIHSLDNLNLPDEEVSQRNSTAFATPNTSLVNRGGDNADLAEENDPASVILEPKVSADIEASAAEEEKMEVRRRNLFIRLHQRYYEASRRVYFSEMVLESKVPQYKNMYKKGGAPGGKKHYNYKVQTSQVCPANCGKPHLNTLFHCNLFKKMMNVDERKRLVDKLIKSNMSVCRRCLLYGFHQDSHQVTDAKCPAQKQFGIECKHPQCKSDKVTLTHSPLLCRFLNRDPPPGGRGRAAGGQSSQAAGGQRGRARGRARGRGSSRGRGRGQFKRENRKSRISASEKSYRTDGKEAVEEDVDPPSYSDCWEDSINQVLFIQAGNNFSVAESAESNRQVDISCASSCVLTHKGKDLMGCVLFDSGSSLSFIRESVARQLQLEPVSRWNGFLATLTTKEDQSFDVYLVEVRGEAGSVFKVPCLGCPDIGVREQADTAMIATLCAASGVSRAALDLSGGPLSILLGTNAFRLFPKLVKAPKQDKLETKHPNVKLFYSKLSQSLFFSGQCGSNWAKELKDVKSKKCRQQAKNFMIRGRRMFRASFGKGDKVPAEDEASGSEVANPSSIVSTGASQGDKKVAPDEVSDTTYSSYSCADRKLWQEICSTAEIYRIRRLERENKAGEETVSCGSIIDDILNEDSSEGSGASLAGTMGSTNHYDVPRLLASADHLDSDTYTREDRVTFRGNKYKVIGFHLNDRCCFLRLSCVPEECNIHKSIADFRRALVEPDTNISREAEYLRNPPYGYCNMAKLKTPGQNML